MARACFRCGPTQKFLNLYFLFSSDVVQIFNNYDLVREDLDTIATLVTPNDKEADALLKRIDTKTKTAFTLALKKDDHKYSYARKNDVVITQRRGSKRQAAEDARKRLQMANAEADDEDEPEDETPESDEAEAQAEILAAF